MFKVEKHFRFEAAHSLPYHDGKCRRLHGHSYRGVLVAEAQELQTEGPKRGMVIDYADLETAIAPLLEKYLDHRFLNESLPLHDTTAEAIAKWIYEQVKPSVPLLTTVVIEETCTSKVEYRP